MADRIADLEDRLAKLSAAVAAVEGRLAALEGERAVAPPAPVQRREAEPEETAASAPLAGASGDAGPGAAILAGRLLLGLGGGYLVRALTDAGTLPRLGGVVLGLAYALAWVVAADRGARSGRRLAPTLDGVLSLAVALPLLWEATVRLGAIPPPLAAALLAGVGAAVFAVAWRRDLAGLAWTATLGALGTAWSLLLATARIELFTILLILFGAGTLWSTYGRRWHALRWPAAIAADLAVLALVFLGSRPGGPPEAYRELGPGRAAFVALLLFVVYAGSFAVRTLARQRSVNVFEVAQTAAVLAVGYLGAVRLAHAAGTGETALAVAALVLSALAYGAAFGFVSRDSAGSRNFLFFSSVALLLALTGGSLLVAGGTLALVWAAIGFAAALLGARFGRRSLESHAAVYLVAAAFPSGLVEAVTLALTGPGAGAGASFGRLPAVVTVAAGLSYVAAARARRDRVTSARRGIRLEDDGARPRRGLSRGDPGENGRGGDGLARLGHPRGGRAGNLRSGPSHGASRDALRRVRRLRPRPDGGRSDHAAGPPDDGSRAGPIP
ncbi:MAG: hypothetical protein KJ062_08750 [Thermoanaerobaculia bacterium]|nr:hypothetical protein [Thermoanaerobaculia bacterium]